MHRCALSVHMVLKLGKTEYVKCISSGYNSKFLFSFFFFKGPGAPRALPFSPPRPSPDLMPIRAGAAPPFYTGLKTSIPAVPGYKPPLKALCVVPKGMEEGTELLIEGREFGLVTGCAAEFRFFSSSVRSALGRICPGVSPLRDLDNTGLLEIEIPALGDVP